MYTSVKIFPNVYRIIDPLQVAMYLVIGENKCALIDTGYGHAGLKEYISTITSLPVIVLLTHGHIDHALGIYEFDEIHMNHLDLGTYKVHSDDRFRDALLKVSGVNIDNFVVQEKREIDFIDIKDLEEFDLGGTTIKAFHVPGHTFGMTMMLLVEQRAIIFGDGCGPGTILLEDFSTDVSTYLNSLMKVKEYEDMYDTILRNHGTYVSSKQLLDNVIELCNNVINNEDDKVLLDKKLSDVLSNGHDYRMYQAKKTLINSEGHEVRVDGKEGNLSYREDKVNR